MDFWQSALAASPLTLSLLALLAIVALLHRISPWRTGKSSASPPHRDQGREKMNRLQSEIQIFKELAQKNATNIENLTAGIAEFKADVNYRFNVSDERQRKNDTQTAVQIAELATIIREQTNLIASKGGFRDNTPPEGNELP